MLLPVVSLFMCEDTRVIAWPFLIITEMAYENEQKYFIIESYFQNVVRVNVCAGKFQTKYFQILQNVVQNFWQLF